MKQISPGTVVNNKFKFIEKIGETDTSVVWKAENLLLEKIVAIKMLDTTKMDQSSGSELLQEARVTAKLKHKNIIEVYDFDRLDHDDMFIMEYLQGASLEEVIINLRNKGQRMTEEDAIRITLDVAAALDYAHTPTENKREILHRDLKPANIYITDEGKVKLLDLGIAKVTSPHSKSATVRNGYTPSYTDPSLWREGTYKCDEYTSKNEVYCLGLVFYEMLTGNTPIELTDSLLVGDYEPPLRMDDISESLREVLEVWISPKDSRLLDANKVLKLMSNYGSSNSTSIQRLVADIDKDAPYHISQTVIDYRKTVHSTKDNSSSIFPEIELIRPLSLKLLAKKGENSEVHLNEFKLTFPFPSPVDVQQLYSTTEYDKIEESSHILFRLLFYIQLTSAADSNKYFNLENLILRKNLLRHLEERYDSRHIAFTIAFCNQENLKGLKKWLQDNWEKIPYKEALESTESLISISVSDYIYLVDQGIYSKDFTQFIRDQLNGSNRHIPVEEIKARGLIKIIDALEYTNAPLKKATYDKIIYNLFKLEMNSIDRYRTYLFTEYFSRRNWEVSEEFSESMIKTLYEKWGDTPEWNQLGIGNKDAISGYKAFFDINVFEKQIDLIHQASKGSDVKDNHKIFLRLNTLKMFSEYINEVKLFHNDLASFTMLKKTGKFDIHLAKISAPILIASFNNFKILIHLSSSTPSHKTYSSIFLRDNTALNNIESEILTDGHFNRCIDQRDQFVREVPHWEKFFPVFLDEQHQFGLHHKLRNSLPVGTHYSESEVIVNQSKRKHQAITPSTTSEIRIKSQKTQEASSQELESLIETLLKKDVNF